MNSVNCKFDWHILLTAGRVQILKFKDIHKHWKSVKSRNVIKLYRVIHLMKFTLLPSLAHQLTEYKLLGQIDSVTLNVYLSSLPTNPNSNTLLVTQYVPRNTRFVMVYIYTHTYTDRQTCIHLHTCLLLILMLCHKQAIFESKGDRSSSAAECRIRTWEVWDTKSPADWMPPMTKSESHVRIFGTGYCFKRHLSITTEEGNNNNNCN